MKSWSIPLVTGRGVSIRADISGLESAEQLALCPSIRLCRLWCHLRMRHSARTDAPAARKRDRGQPGAPPVVSMGRRHSRAQHVGKRMLHCSGWLRFERRHPMVLAELAAERGDWGSLIPSGIDDDGE